MSQNQNQITVIKKQLQVKGTKVIATSKAVAEGFERKHYNVIRDIEALEIPEEFSRLNFEAANYLDAQGKNRKMYTMTRDGFTLLVMGYLGKRAMKIKIAYIEAFNQMDRELAAKREARPVVISELLSARPVWGKIARYKRMGLSHADIAILTRWNVATVRKHVRRMEACGILREPENLPRQRICARNLIDFRSGKAVN